MNDGAGRIEEVTVGTARERTKILCQRLTGQRPGGQNGDFVGRWQRLLLPAFDRDQGMLIECFGKGSAVTATINRQCTAGWNGMVIRRFNHQRSQPAHLLLKKTGGSITA